MVYLKRAAKKFKVLIAVYVAMGLAQSFLQSFGAKYFQTVVDNFTSGRLTAINIAIYGAAMIALYVVCYLDEYPGRKLEHGIKLELKTAALKKLAAVDYLSSVKLGTGALTQRIENGAEAGGNMLFGFYLRLACELFPAMIFSVAFVYSISRAVAFAILFGYVFVFLVANLLLKALYKVKESILINEEKYNRLLVRGIMELVTFRVNRRFAREIKKAEDAAGGIVSSKTKMAMTHEAFFASFAVMIAFVKIGVLVYGWKTGSLTVGQAVALIALTDGAYQPIAVFNVLYVQYKLDKIAFARYASFLGLKDDPRLSGGEPPSDFSGGVSFSGVDFSYDGREVFRNFNLEIEGGKFTAFVGESGSGKSTAVKLAAGLLRPDNGTVRAGGRDLNEIDLNEYYGRIAYLPQEASVFDGSLRENLVFDDAAGDAELTEVINKAGLGDLFLKLGDGFETQLGERGVALSGGERQQLALARLMLADAELIFLDEATSAMDNLTEEAVIKNAAGYFNGKTVIAVAHRLDSIKEADKIYAFRDGEIAEEGKFAELMERRGFFYELYTS